MTASECDVTSRPLARVGSSVSVRSPASRRVARRWRSRVPSGSVLCFDAISRVRRNRRAEIDGPNLTIAPAGTQ